MSRCYEYYREDGDSIDWDTRNEYDRQVQDSIDAEPVFSRFELPSDYVPQPIPPVEPSEEYNAFDTFTKEDWDSWYQRHNYL